MGMKKAVVMLSALFLANQAFAETKNFEGFSVGLNAEMMSTTLKLKVDDATFEGVGRQDVVASLAGDYGFGITQNTVLLVGAKYFFPDAELLKITANGLSVSAKQENHFSIYAAPGYTFNENTLGYVKVSYENFDGKISEEGINESQSLNGVGLGFGFRVKLQDNLYANLEAGKLFYTENSFNGLSTDTGATTGTLGLSYKF